MSQKLELVYSSICESNLQAASGSDGIPSLFYKECWKIMDDSLHAVMNDIFEEKKLPPSLRTSLMVFGAKPKKPGSILPKDKRRISLLNSDFKIATGLEAKWKGTLKQEDIPCPYMTLTDELEMVGVELKATWTQTRKTNGDAIQKRVSSKINLWKGGKFMPLSMRSWSINTYGLSKVWFKTHSVDLRVLDITNINKSVKSWLYADMLFKPEEMIMVRSAQYGGLGVHDIKYKALAGLIRSILETACNTDFRHSLFHEILYRYHVMDDKSICLLYTSPSPRDPKTSRMPSSA